MFYLATKKPIVSDPDGKDTPLTSNKNSGLGAGTISGIVVGVIIILVLIMTVVVVRVRTTFNGDSTLPLQRPLQPSDEHEQAYAASSPGPGPSNVPIQRVTPSRLPFVVNKSTTRSALETCEWYQAMRASRNSARLSGTFDVGNSFMSQDSYTI